VNLDAIARRIRQTFGISAPRVAVRTHLSWRWKTPALLALCALIGGMWWWGFDFGQFLGGFNRSAIVEKQDRIEKELASLREENARLRSKASALESELSMTQGAQAASSRQALEVQNENTQMKEELAFLQKLFSDEGKLGTITIQRFTTERVGDDAYRFSLLIVRGGNPTDEFSGKLSLQVALVVGGHAESIVLPDDQPEMAPALKLKFKYYQRVEGMMRVPTGSSVRTLEAKVMELGQDAPKATRNLNMS
jgi:uncharacterized protein DUF6776